MLGVQKSLIYLSQRLAAAGGANDANDYPHQLNVIWCLCRVRLRLQFLPPTLPSHFFGAQDSHKTSVAPDKHLRDLKSREISDVLKLLRVNIRSLTLREVIKDATMQRKSGPNCPALVFSCLLMSSLSIFWTFLDWPRLTWLIWSRTWHPSQSFWGSSAQILQIKNPQRISRDPSSIARCC